MTLLRSIIRAGDNIFSTRCFLLNKNNWNVESYFGSKVEVPSPPKRPLTAYMIFCRENRKVILKDNPSLSTPEQIKVLAKKWSHLTEDMKKPYELSAREHTQLYGEQHKKFYESLTEEQKEELTRLKTEKRESRRISKFKKLLRDSGMPKLPNSAYTLFVQAEAKKSPSIKNGPEFIKKVAEEWNSLPEVSKKIFEQQAEERKRCHLKEMKEWFTKIKGDKKLVRAYEEVKGRGLKWEEEMFPVEEKKAPSKSKN